jgi:hypothetical protein
MGRWIAAPAWVSLLQHSTVWGFPISSKGRYMAVATITSAPTGPLSQSQQHEVAAAHDRARKVRKAAAVAKFNGWVTGILAACSAPFALFSLPGFLVTAGLSLVAYNEFKGRQRLLQFDQEAPAFLGWNQVSFLALIISYCIWMLVVGLTSEGPLAAEMKAQPELSVLFDSVDEFDQFYRILIAAIYGTVIMLSAVFQGLNAIYYFTRRKYVTAYVQNTPEWVLDLQHLTSPT